MDVKTKKYNLFFMDGYSQDDVVQRRIRKVPPREKKKKLIGQRFYDEGDYKPGMRGHPHFKKGEFIVLCYQPGKSPSYWCERDTGDKCGKKRDIQEFDCGYVEKLVEKYDKE